MEAIAISKIQIGQRHRKDLGDIDGLAKSISEIGLLNPVILNSKYQLIAGARRVAAAKKLGWLAVSAMVVASLDDARKALMAERDENTERENFTPSEAVALGKQLEEMERPKAKERQEASRAKEGERVGGGTGAAPNAARVRDVVGEAVGMSGHTYERAKSVVDNGIPELVEAMDKGDIGIRPAAEIAQKPEEAQRAILQNRAPKTPAPPGGIVPQTRTYSGRKAPEAIRGAIGTLVGLATGFDQFTVQQAAPSDEEAAQWEKDLASVIAALNRFRRQLKEQAHV